MTIAGSDIEFKPFFFQPFLYSLQKDGRIGRTDLIGAVIQNGTIRLVNVKNQDGITKILDMVPEFVDKFTKKNDDSAIKEVKEEAGKEMSNMLDASVNKES